METTNLNVNVQELLAPAKALNELMRISDTRQEAVEGW